MKNTNSNTKENIVSFLKKYGYIFALVALTLIVTIILAVTATKPTTDDIPPVNNDPVTFYNPVINATVAKGYSDTNLMFNETLNQWEAHKAIDFKVAENADVYAVLDGKVVDIKTNYQHGTTVIVEHANNIKTVYSSLNEDVKVKKGDSIKRGALIGTAGSTANNEVKTGAHLHFQVLENNVAVDPLLYLEGIEK